MANPVREVERIEAKSKREPRALTMAERVELLELSRSPSAMDSTSRAPRTWTGTPQPACSPEVLTKAITRIAAGRTWRMPGYVAETISSYLSAHGPVRGQSEQ